MPFKSQAQRRFMYAKHPKIAKRWSKEYPNQANLPEKVKGKKRSGSKEIKDVIKYGKKRGL